jgi:hypothetical protein
MAPAANSRLTTQDIGNAKVSAVITGVTASMKNMRTAGHPFRVLLSSFIENHLFSAAAEVIKLPLRFFPVELPGLCRVP